MHILNNATLYAMLLLCSFAAVLNICLSIYLFFIGALSQIRHLNIVILGIMTVNSILFYYFNFLILLIMTGIVKSYKTPLR